MYRTFGFLFSATVLLFCFSGGAFADEYGERFHNSTPAGMAEFTAPSDEVQDIAMDDMAASLQDIMPAAGEEVIEETPEPEVVENISEEPETAAE